MNVPDAIEPVVGWRTWRVRDAGSAFILTSASKSTHWPGGRALEARCERGRSHRPPERECTCGIYASFHPGPALELLPPYVRAVSSIIAPAILGYDTVMAVGLASLWGELVVCDRGWRAEYAYPRELFVPSSVKHYRRGPDGLQIFDSSDLAEALAETYGIETRVVWNLRPMPLAELVRGVA